MSEFSFSPRNFFLGDRVTGVYSFSSNIFSLSGPVEIDASGEEFNNDAITFHSIKITGDGSTNYKIEFDFTPWKTGTIELPPIELSKISDSSGIITLPKITVDSIIRATERNEIQPPCDPVLMPGTTTMIYIFLCIFTAALCAIFFAVLKGGKLFAKFRVFIRNTFKSREFKAFLRGCKPLEKRKNKFSPKEFFERLNLLTRTYLQNHFDKSFLSTVSPKIQYLFDDFLQSNYQDEILVVANLCKKSDYIRFAPNTPEILEDDERFETLKRIKSAIRHFEDGNNG